MLIPQELQLSRKYMTLRKADCDCLTTAVVKSAHPGG